MRFTFAAEMEVPEGLMAVMAAEQVEGREGSGHFVFRMPQPIPSYLFALAAGNLEFRELGPRTGIYAEPQIIEAAAWEFAENEAKMRRPKNCWARICGDATICWCFRHPSRSVAWKTRA